MNVTKNKLIEALNYLGEFPKTALKKDELIEKLDQIYDKDIEKLLTVINIKIYNLIKKLIKSNEKGIDVEIEYEPEVYFLEDILVIDEPIIDSQKIHIKFNEGMRENRYARFGISKADILLPKEGIDLEKWAVVACDQYTSEKEYWKKVEEFVADEPSTLHLILPECYLEESDKERRIENINSMNVSNYCAIIND